MIVGVDFTLSYTTVTGILSLRIIFTIASTEGLIIFVSSIYDDFQNTIIPNPEERVYLIFPHLYLEWIK